MPNIRRQPLLTSVVVRYGIAYDACHDTGEALLAAFRTALQTYRDRESWQTLMRNGMAKDFSWGTAAKEYVRMFERVKQLRAVAGV